MRYKLLITISCVFLAIGLVVWAYLMVSVVSYRNVYQPANANAILVLGHASDQQGLPSPWLEQRLQTAHRLYTAGYAPYIIVSGGTGRRDIMPIANTMYNYLVSLGVSSQSIIKEPQASNTYENFYYAKQIAQSRNIDSIVLVTSSFHIYRSLVLGNTYFNDISPVASYVAITPSAIFAYIREPLSIVANYFVYIH